MEESLYSLAVAFLLEIQFAEAQPTKEKRDALLYTCLRRTIKNKVIDTPLANFEQAVLEHIEQEQYPSHKRNFLLALENILLLCQQAKSSKETVDTLTQLRIVYIKNPIYSQANKTTVETICYVLINTNKDPQNPMLP